MRLIVKVDGKPVKQEVGRKRDIFGTLETIMYAYKIGAGKQDFKRIEIKIEG